MGAKYQQRATFAAPVSTTQQTASTRPEAQLLLACARTTVSPYTVARIRELLQEDLDWTYVLEKAHEHFITPLLYWNINATAPAAVPPKVLDCLRNFGQLHTRRNLLLTGELLKLLNLFDSHQIPALPYKGPVLALTAYGNLSLRQFGDLDILVHKRDVLRTKELLVARGYRPVTQMTAAQETAHIRSARRKDYRFESADGKILVELHWRITAKYFSFPLNYEQLWRRLDAISFGGGTVRNLKPEDLLLILCAHGSKHLWERLEWICDVAELLRSNPRMDAEDVIKRADAHRSRRMLLLGLVLARDLLGTAIPDAFSKAIQADPPVNDLAGQVCEHLFHDAKQTHGSLETFLFHLRMREQLRDKLRLSYHHGLRQVRSAVTPNKRDQVILNLPASLSSLYYFLRPIRLLREYGPILSAKVIKRAPK